MAGNKAIKPIVDIVAVDGEVALSIRTDDALAGCALSPGEAARAAFALLGAAGRAMGNGEDDAIGIPGFSYRFDTAVAEDLAVSLILKNAKAAIAFPFSATQFTEFTAEATQVCRRIG